MSDGIVDGPLEPAGLQHWHRLEQCVTERVFARTVHHAFERVVPQRDEAAAVEYGDALVKRFDRFLAAVLIFELPDVRAVGAVSEEQRQRRYWHQFPQLVI